MAEALPRFRGIEHRLEPCGALGGVRFYNDSAATIPHATVAALRALTPPVHLIAGGTDKNIDFQPLVENACAAARIYLLAGTATERLAPLLRSAGIPFEGPFPDLEAAVLKAAGDAGDGVTVVFSPGCASFGMFQNEFDRGRRYKAIVQGLIGRS